jgi:hypothetical protein
MPDLLNFRVKVKPMQTENLRAVFVSRQPSSPAGWTVKRVLSWVARGGTLALVCLAVLALLDRPTVSEAAKDIANQMSEITTPRSNSDHAAFMAEMDRYFAEADRQLE